MPEICGYQKKVKRKTKMPQVKVTVDQKTGTHSIAAARKHKIDIDRAEAKGGTDIGAMGGEIFLMGLGGCFISNLIAAVDARGADIKNIGVEVAAELAESPARFSDIELRVKADYSDEKEMQKLITIAERGCIVSNTIKGGVNIKTLLA